MAAAVSLVGLPTIAAGGDPVAFAKTLFAPPDLWTSIAATPESRGEYLTPALIRWVVNVDGDFVDYLDYDPLADSRPFQLTDETFTLVGVDDSGARVKVDYKNYGRPHTVTLRLVGSGDHWRLADIDFPDGRTLLRDLQLAVMCH